ncbi:Adaptive-response sensory-kinase SasA [Pseudoalteromonas holothuriae]|uniref:histidine kinase n=1 Tax=Pseudoalteromonas holothuriae TaxID=2963714 RepID=A0A9W4QYI0_9GAMM|nr:MULTISPECIES: HAMP domain-containing sensor histidine kinase [unclassified Pseudoalteromonas]CAH9057947.1 Adaptive-response sensory-kinase SasA [Pseudoalteromonas sp. CIP111951]CAH9058738.1 Adaptive-response sensory-kinase SasA [Pseudoalteromonas sp. CIP111854]
MKQLLNSMSFTNLFKHTLLCWLSACVVLLLMIVNEKSQLKKHQTLAFSELVSEIVTLYEDDQVNGLIDEFDVEKGLIWDKVQSDTHLDEEGFLFALTSNKHLIAGSASLKYTTEHFANWHSYFYNDNSSVQVISIALPLDEHNHVHLVQRINDEYVITAKHLDKVLLWFSLLSLPLFFLAMTFTHVARARELIKLQSALAAIPKEPDSRRIATDKSAKELFSLIGSINQMLDEVTQLHSTMKTMSVGIAHDLKTPLSRVANRLQSMQLDVEQPTLLQDHLDRASTDLTSVITTFNNLVQLNSIESGQCKQSFKQLNISLLILDLAQSFEPVFADSGKSLEISIADNVYCNGDKDLINQLVSNLLENALEHSESNAKVWIRLQNHVNGALLQVGDSGPGIASIDKDQVFNKFYRADKSRSKQGNGLGLSIVEAICTVHGATIHLLEAQDGAVFNIELSRV